MVTNRTARTTYAQAQVVTGLTNYVSWLHHRTCTNRASYKTSPQVKLFLLGSSAPYPQFQENRPSSILIPRRSIFSAELKFQV